MTFAEVPQKDTSSLCVCTLPKEMVPELITGRGVTVSRFNDDARKVISERATHKKPGERGNQINLRGW